MSAKEIAEELDGTLTKHYSDQEEASSTIDKLIRETRDELFPIVEVLKKHGVSFGFGDDIVGGATVPVAGKTTHGILVGKTIARDGSPRLLALSGDKVISIDERKDAVIDAEAMTIRKFIRTANLEMVKLGFDFVRGAMYYVGDVEVEKTRQLRMFLIKNPKL
jgi:hypothetical protein